MEKIQHNCGRCGVIVMAYESDIMIRCPPCRRLDNQETAAGLVSFQRSYGWFSLFLLVLWCFSVPLSFASLLGFFEKPYAGIWMLIFILLPFWGLYSSLSFWLRVSSLFLTICLFTVIDDYFFSGFILKGILVRLIP
jgi:hypothetical protein